MVSPPLFSEMLSLDNDGTYASTPPFPSLTFLSTSSYQAEFSEISSLMMSLDDEECGSQLGDLVSLSDVHSSSTESLCNTQDLAKRDHKQNNIDRRV